jgi:hypothetical protein
MFSAKRYGPLRLFLAVRRVAAIAASIAVGASAVRGQVTDSVRQPATPLIGVFDSRTGNPLQSVQVRDGFSGTYALTTVTGTARLSFLTFRGVAAFVELRKLGYQAKQIVVTRGDTTPITELLEPIAELAPVVTTEAYRIDRDAGNWVGFEQRCQSASVTCFRNQDLLKNPSANLADLLIHANGMTIGSCGAVKTRNGQCGRIAMRSAVIPPAYCQPTFFVDGFEWNPRLGSPSDLTPGRPPEAPYTPANVKGIEVYPPERSRPLRFQGGDPTCGVVVIWTK